MPAIEEYLEYCKKVLPLPAMLVTCRQCPDLPICTALSGPAPRCPLMIIPAAVANTTVTDHT